MDKVPDVRTAFAALDDVLVERVFQPLADLISNQVRLSRAKTACFCIDAASLAWIVSRMHGLSVDGTGRDCVAPALNVAMLLLGLTALISLRSLFRRTMNRKQANPLRPAMQPHRAIVLVMLASRVIQLTPFDLTGAADLAMLLCAASALYLGACVERPPVRRQDASLVPAAIRG